MENIKKSNDKLSFSCKYHKEYNPQYILLNSEEEEEDILLCNQCIDLPKYSKLQLGDFQQMENLLKSDDSTILHKWPPLPNQNILREVQEHFNKYANETKNYPEVIVEHFDHIKKTIIDHIEDLKKQTLLNYNKLPELEKEFYRVYNIIAEKDKVKEILLQRDASFEEVQSNFVEYLREKEEMMQENEEAITEIYNLHKQYTAQLNPKKLNDLSQKIITTAKNATYFPPVGDLINYSIEKLADIQNEGQESIINSSLSPSVKTLLELINNPLNFLSEEYQSSLAESIIQLTPYLNFNKESQKNNQHIQQRKIDQNQIGLVSKLIEKKKEIEDYFKDSQVREKVFPLTKRIIDSFEGSIRFTDIKNVLLQIPVFELIESNMDFNISNYQNSKTSLQRHMINSNQIQFLKKSNSNDWNNTIVSDIYLLKDITYKIQFQIQRNSGYEDIICVGLISNLKNSLNNQKLCCQLGDINSYNNQGINVVKKGSKEHFKSQSYFELIVNLQQGILEISDFPSFNTTVVINNNQKKFIQESPDFHYIAFSLLYANDSIIINKIEQIKSN